MHGTIPKRACDLTDEQIVGAARWLLLQDGHKASQVLSRMGTYKGLGQAHRVVEQMLHEYETNHNVHFHQSWFKLLPTLRELVDPPLEALEQHVSRKECLFYG